MVSSWGFLTLFSRALLTTPLSLSRKVEVRSLIHLWVKCKYNIFFRATYKRNLEIILCMEIQFFLKLSKFHSAQSTFYNFYRRFFQHIKKLQNLWLKKGNLSNQLLNDIVKLTVIKNIWYWYKIGVEQFKNKPKSIKELAIFQKK